MTSSAKIRALVCHQIITALQEDLDGGELLMKEVWEECASSATRGDDRLVASTELEEILTWLRERERSFGEEG